MEYLHRSNSRSDDRSQTSCSFRDLRVLDRLRHGPTVLLAVAPVVIGGRAANQGLRGYEIGRDDDLLVARSKLGVS